MLLGMNIVTCKYYRLDVALKKTLSTPSFTDEACRFQAGSASHSCTLASILQK
jgi:hypothetical protein